MDRWTQLFAVEGATHDLSIFSPASPATQSIVDLAILTLAIIALIFIVVEGVLFYSVWRFREGAGEPADPRSGKKRRHQPGSAQGEPAQVYGSQPIEVAWTAAPTMIVFFLVLVTARTLWEVNLPPPQPSDGDGALFVTVTGRQWWWEYAYETYDGRKLGFFTANELHIPASSPRAIHKTHLTLQSADVCHSFWAPRLAGKVDLIPGKINTLSLQASEPGLYVGQCAEYCGTQHANMLIRVVVDTPEDFDNWLMNQSRPAVEDSQVAAGKEAFLAQSCVNCHRVRGTPAAGKYAPDLTHLMSRATLASGEIENTADNLADWVRDPQSIKPGCLMPAFKLSTSDQELIVEYLRTLR